MEEMQRRRRPRCGGMRGLDKETKRGGSKRASAVDDVDGVFRAENRARSS